MGDCSSSRRSNSWYTERRGKRLSSQNIKKIKPVKCICHVYPIRFYCFFSICDLWHRQDWFREDWLDVLCRTCLTFRSQALMPRRCRSWEGLSSSECCFACVACVESAVSVNGPTVDNKLPVLLLWVLHGVKCLLGDAVQVHIPPVLQHLKGDVGVVYHGPRCLGMNTQAIAILIAQAVVIRVVFIETKMTQTWHRWFKDVCRFRIWENLLDTKNKNTVIFASLLEGLVADVMHSGEIGILRLHSNLMFLRFSGRSWSAIFNHSSSCFANFLITWVKLWTEARQTSQLKMHPN